MKKLTAIVITLLTVVMLFSVTALAEESVQDGVALSLVTDKAEYAEGEAVTATVTVTNTNDFAVTDVLLESTVPEGYRLAQNSEAAKEMETLGAGESAVLTAAYTPDGAANTETGNGSQNTEGNGENNDPALSAPDEGGTGAPDGGKAPDGGDSTQNGAASNPRTGDDANVVLYTVLLIISGIGIIIAVLLGKKKGKALLSILLCAVLIGSGFSVMPAYAAQEDGAAKSAEVSTTVKVGDKDITVSAKVRYTLPDSTGADDGENGDEPARGKILVAYFSATNTTERIAEYLAGELNADLYEIVPAVPYTSADLNYGNSSSRTSIEMNDAACRPEISGSVENMGQYDIVFLGYPIWWGQAPRIISTFLESYDFSGKTVVPFCTSASSGIGSSATNLHDLTDSAQWLDGRRFSGSASSDTVLEWANGLDLGYGNTQPAAEAAATAVVFAEMDASNALLAVPEADSAISMGLSDEPYDSASEEPNVDEGQAYEDVSNGGAAEMEDNYVSLENGSAEMPLSVGN